MSAWRPIPFLLAALVLAYPAAARQTIQTTGPAAPARWRGWISRFRSPRWPRRWMSWARWPKTAS